jgi:uncharacterized protein YdeI (YjbR/CyaY-like superfamily)
MNLKVDQYIAKIKRWQKETETLRMILLSCDLTEDIKWGKPCYGVNGTNLFVIQGFKEYFALLFFKGILLKDPDNILVKTGENTRVGRQVRFQNVQQIIELESVLKEYIHQAIELEKAGIKVDPKQDAKLIFPEEFQARLDEDPNLQTAFSKLSPGRQKQYNMHFSAPKQSQTRQSRVEKAIPQILSGKGLND